MTNRTEIESAFAAADASYKIAYAKFDSVREAFRATPKGAKADYEGFAAAQAAFKAALAAYDVSENEYVLAIEADADFADDVLEDRQIEMFA